MMKGCIKENSTIHGIKDYTEASGSCAKTFWAIALILSLAGLGWQLSMLFSAYLNEETGSTVGVWEPDRFPTIGICPSLWDIGGGIDKYLVTNKETMSDMEKAQVINYISGYFTLGPYHLTNAIDTDLSTKLFNDNVDPIRQKALKIIRGAYNGSLEKYSLDNSIPVDAFIAHAFTMPVVKTIQKSKFVNLCGVCYTVAINETFTRLQQQYNHFIIRLNQKVHPGYEYAPEYLQYFFFSVGGISEDGVVPAGIHPYSYKGFTHIGLVPRGMLSYSSRKNPCDPDPKYAMSDFRRCQIDVANRIGCKDSCKLFVTQSKNHQAQDQDPSTLCNAHDNGINSPCLNSAMTLTKTEWSECLMPCRHEFFGVVMGNNIQNNVTTLEITMQSPHLGTYIKEYPLYTMTTFACNIGGTSSLWFGASLLSYIQVSYYLGQALIRRLFGGHTAVGSNTDNHGSYK